MGNFHCIPESCARVVWREYLPPIVRWRYPDEDWQEIEADNYELELANGQCPTKYHLFGTYKVANLSNCTGTGYWRTSFAVHRDDAVSFIPELDNQGDWAIKLTNGVFSKLHPRSEEDYNKNYLPDLRNFGFKNYQVDYPNRPCINTNFPYGYEVQSTKLVRVDGQPDDCGDCTFTIRSNDEIVHQEIRDVCPEVEQLPCRLSDISQEIKIEKTPWLSRIEVVDYAYDVRLGLLVDSDNYGLLLAKKQIPDECLNIYKNNITATIPNDFIQLANQPENAYNQITQICSADGCPPPEYQVICDCNKECPEGTCGIQCGDRICCYGSDGVAVKSIPFNGVFPSGSADGGNIR